MRSSVGHAQFWEMSEFGNSLPPPGGRHCVSGMPPVCGAEQNEGRTSGDQNRTVSHNAAHLLATIAPPIRSWRIVTAQMTLPLILDVE